MNEMVSNSLRVLTSKKISNCELNIDIDINCASGYQGNMDWCREFYFDNQMNKYNQDKNVRPDASDNNSEVDNNEDCNP